MLTSLLCSEMMRYSIQEPVTSVAREKKIKKNKERKSGPRYGGAPQLRYLDWLMLTALQELFHRRLCLQRKWVDSR